MSHKFRAKDDVLITSGAHAGAHAVIVCADSEPGEPAYSVLVDGDPVPMTYPESELGPAYAR